MKTIVALVDFSERTSLVLKHAESLAKVYNGRVIIIHALRAEPVVDEYSATSGDIITARGKAALAGQESLVDLRDSMKKAGIPVATQQLVDATMETILAESRSLGADLIIVGSHHHSALYNLFVGSFTQDLLKHATCPVLVVPAIEPS